MIASFEKIIVNYKIINDFPNIKKKVELELDSSIFNFLHEILHSNFSKEKLLRTHTSNIILQIYVGTNNLELGNNCDTKSQKTKINKVNCNKRQNVSLHTLF